jgi:hypothetical protein
MANILQKLKLMMPEVKSWVSLLSCFQIKKGLMLILNVDLMVNVVKYLLNLTTQQFQ